jgi:hypothetical protein
MEKTTATYKVGQAWPNNNKEQKVREIKNYNIQIAVGPERRESETLGDYLIRTSRKLQKESDE